MVISIKKIWVLITVIGITCAAWFSSCQVPSGKTQAPNILLIVTDDMAYGDLSMTGNTFVETPCLDNLAKEGIFASHFYVSPVCAPTRASLLTGRYHQRTGVSGVTRGREDMKLDETTMSDILKSLDYQTGIFGKWHNGAHYPYHPLGRGFDTFVGFTSGHWSNYFDTTIERNGKPFKTDGYLPDILTSEAIKFIHNAHEQQKPFFCYVPYQTPHTPLQVPDQYFNKYKAKGLDDFNACIYGMCENIDDNVQKLIKKLEDLEIKENTIIIFLSDNGPVNFRYNSNLKGRKGSVDEGGVKVPFILNWEGHIEPGKIISESIAHIDILPTILDLIDMDYEPSKPLDGQSFTSLLNDESLFPKRKLFEEWSGKKRVLSYPFLLINENLFNMEDDPSQKTDLREQHPEVYDSLLIEWEKWHADVYRVPVTSKPIPVGYPEYPMTVLPAHEANLYPPFEFRKDRKHTGIAYHSLYGWAHDWIDFWTKTEAWAQWEIDVVNDGEYLLEMNYSLSPEDVGVIIELEIDQHRKKILLDKPFEHESFPNHDRVIRKQEAPETNWATIELGKFRLEKGVFSLIIRSKEIPGEKSIELKEVIVNKLK